MGKCKYCGEHAEATLTAFAGKRQNLTDAELNVVIGKLEIRPTEIRL